MIARPTKGTITIYLNSAYNIISNIGSSFPLLTIYSDEGDEQLSVSIGRDVSLYYEDVEELPEEGNYMTFDVSIDDELLVTFLFLPKE